MTIAVDFDGTIVEHEYPYIGKEIPFAIAALKKLQAERHLLILWSVREGELLDEAVEYCRKRGLEFYAVNSPTAAKSMQTSLSTTAMPAACPTGAPSTRWCTTDGPTNSISNRCATARTAPRSPRSGSAWPAGDEGRRDIPSRLHGNQTRKTLKKLHHPPQAHARACP